MKKFSLWVGATMMAIPAVAFAVDTPNLGPEFVTGINTLGDVESKILQAINWFLSFVLLVAVIMIIWGGLQYMSGEKPDDARKKVTNGIIGAAIAMGAFAIVAIVKSFLRG